MTAKITWSPSAVKSFNSLILFLETKWERKVIEKLFTDLNNSLHAISENPQMFPCVSLKKKLHKCVLRRKTFLLYRVKTKEHIEMPYRPSGK